MNKSQKYFSFLLLFCAAVPLYGMERKNSSFLTKKNIGWTITGLGTCFALFDSINIYKNGLEHSYLKNSLQSIWRFGKNMVTLHDLKQAVIGWGATFGLWNAYLHRKIYLLEKTIYNPLKYYANLGAGSEQLQLNPIDMAQQMDIAQQSMAIFGPAFGMLPQEIEDAQQMLCRNLLQIAQQESNNDLPSPISKGVD